MTNLLKSVAILLAGVVVLAQSYPSNLYETHEPPKKNYAFSYGIRDEYAGLDFSQDEASDGHAVKGYYSVQLPDGRKQTVNYEADHQNGYNADVTYEGEASYPPVSNDAPFIVPSQHPSPNYENRPLHVEAKPAPHKYSHPPVHPAPAPVPAYKPAPVPIYKADPVPVYKPAPAKPHPAPAPAQVYKPAPAKPHHAPAPVQVYKPAPAKPHHAPAPVHKKPAPKPVAAPVEPHQAPVYNRPPVKYSRPAVQSHPAPPAQVYHQPSVYPQNNRQPQYQQNSPQSQYPETNPQPQYPETNPQPQYPQTNPQPQYPQTNPQPQYPQTNPQPQYPQINPRPQYSQYTQQQPYYPVPTYNQEEEKKQRPKLFSGAFLKKLFSG